MRPQYTKPSSEGFFSMIDRILAFITYLINARGLSGLDAPFLAELYREVISAYEPLAIGEQVAEARNLLMQSRESVELQDFGAGHGDSGKSTRSTTIGKLAREASCPRPKGELLFRLAQFSNAQRILEMGTQLGLSGWYLQAARPEAEFVGIEGDPVLAELAKRLWEKRNLGGKIYNDVFQSVLTNQAQPSKYRPDFVYLDGHHTYQATLEYTQQLLPYMPENSLLVLDDIHWSKGMTQAWKEVCMREEVSLSVDLFQVGLCFIKRKEPKTHVALRRWR